MEQKEMFNLYMNIKLTINPEILYFQDIQSVHRNFYLIDNLNVKITNNPYHLENKRFIILDDYK